jgi:hypothetical protein
MVLPKINFIKSNTELSQIVLKVRSLLLIYEQWSIEHMAFVLVIFVSLHYLHILHSFTFPHFCQMTELHFCCISKCLSILCFFVFSRNTLVKLLAFLFRNTVVQSSTLYLFFALNQLFATWQHCENGAKLELHCSNLETKIFQYQPSI